MNATRKTYIDLVHFIVRQIALRRFWTRCSGDNSEGLQSSCRAVSELDLGKWTMRAINIVSLHELDRCNAL
jgi:hypothetical protein